MRVLILCVFVFIVQCQEFKLYGLFFGCSKDVTSDYHHSLQDFSTRFLKNVAKDNDNFVISQYSIWLALAAIAEGSNGDIQSTLFKALNLPLDWCYREKYYDIATGLESPGLPEDVYLIRKRFLVLNDDLKLNNTWRDIVGAAGLIITKIVNLKDANTIDDLKNLIAAKLDDMNITENSLILDSLDYKGLWSTEFENSSIEHSADFFNDEGVKVGTVDLLKITKRVKLAHLPILNAKLLELPVGNNGRYRMLFILNNRKKSIRRMIEHFPSSLIVDSFPLLMESVIPLEVAIPRFSMTSELDLKKVIEDVGLGGVWNNNEASKLVLFSNKFVKADQFIVDIQHLNSSLVGRFTCISNYLKILIYSLVRNFYGVNLITFACTN